MYRVGQGIIEPIAHLVHYHAYRIEDEHGDRIVNPKWNGDCKRLLNLKSDSERGFPDAVAHFSKKVGEVLAAHHVPPADLQVHIVVVPSSTAGRWSPGLLKISENLIKQNRNFIDSTRSLVRTKAIDKLSRGGDRSLWTHQQSVGLAEHAATRLARKTVLLLDDVTTSGNSLVACATILQQHAGVARVIPLALGKTV
ncbi:hypothetical protein [Paraburkholderia phenoliruptrix]|uniref:hypothetical protein n=1 Tax=Paraburkholderia phenoliruptrix TaxID=252970 RepID=UPI00286D599C|nr:hypothetical protein [Paraburkholderia phenoliruptrix]